MMLKVSYTKTSIMKMTDSLYFSKEPNWTRVITKDYNFNIEQNEDLKSEFYKRTGIDVDRIVKGTYFVQETLISCTPLPSGIPLETYTAFTNLKVEAI